MNKHTSKIKSLVYATFIVVAIGFLLSLFLGNNIIPNPFEIFMEFLSNFKVLLYNSFFSLLRVFFAILLVIIIGIPIGLILGINRIADNYITPLAYILYPIPKIAFLPVLMLLFGLGDLSKVILVFLILVFQVIISVRDSIQSIEKEMYYSLFNFKPSKIDMLKHLIIPAVLPRLFTSFRISMATSLSVLFLAESYAAKRGIGFYIMDSWAMASYVRMFSGILMISLLGILLFYSIDFLENKLCFWSKIEKKVIRKSNI